MRIQSIQVGLPRTEGDPASDDPMQRQWTSAFDKRAVHGAVRVDWTNLEGDRQADLRVHGGVDKAILAYASAHYDAWRLQLSNPGLPPGAFGENLTVDGLEESTVCIGDRWKVGEVRLEVSQPRQPCWKVARRWQNKLLTKWVGQSGKTGWYLRVLQCGSIAAGDPIELIDRPFPQWTVARCNDFLMSREIDAIALYELMHLPPLADAFKKDLP
jgi:MOSC domain-containing protein YiiM